MLRSRTLCTALAVAAALVGFTGCSDSTTEPTKAGTFTGTAKPLGNGTATPWVTLDAAGNPTSVGVTLTAAALEGLPTAGAPVSLNLPFPSQGSTTAYNHVGLDFLSTGHP